MAALKMSDMRTVKEAMATEAMLTSGLQPSEQRGSQSSTIRRRELQASHQKECVLGKYVSRTHQSLCLLWDTA